MKKIPRDQSPESTMAMLREGYIFISRRCRRYQTDLFQSRLLLQPTICMMGEEAAKIFYDPEHFQRHGAAPQRLQKTLFGKPGVQALDGKAHSHRKQMFMSLMTSGHLQQLTERIADQWNDYLERWENEEEIIFFDQMREVLFRAVCAWAAIPLPEEQVRARADQMEGMIDGAGGIGPRFWRGWMDRKRAERWCEDMIRQVREKDLQPPNESALNEVAYHRDLAGELLDARVAAVELLNLLRPTVAVSRYVIFIAMALHDQPHLITELSKGTEEQKEQFVQEVRRYYPFFPFVAAKVRSSFVWRDYHFPEGRRVLLDLYGTNHDSRLWEEPEKFRPERFQNWNGSAFNFIPQGGGDPFNGHRCAGEQLTIEIMRLAVTFLTKYMRYEVPEQDLRISLARIPAIPPSRFRIRKVRRMQ